MDRHDHRRSPVVWITGASSGIGAALVETVPFDDPEVVGISRRGSAARRDVCVDLSDRSCWAAVAQEFATVLDAHPVDHAYLLHFAGEGHPHGFVRSVDADRLQTAALLNGVAGQVVGQAFVQACTARGVPATLVLCLSPAMFQPFPGGAHYGAAKAGLRHWASSVAAEEPPDAVRVLSVVPFGVDTPMLQDVLSLDAEDVPFAAALRDEFDQRAMASPESVAREIWAALSRRHPTGHELLVGAVPSALRES
jgi:short-subunit dehydrogenase